jgi:hypothetical protein
MHILIQGPLAIRSLFVRQSKAWTQLIGVDKKTAANGPTTLKPAYKELCTLLVKMQLLHIQQQFQEFRLHVRTFTSATTTSLLTNSSYTMIMQLYVSMVRWHHFFVFFFLFLGGEGVWLSAVLITTIYNQKMLNFLLS